ncbi:MAG: ECF-type sigma factor [Pseudomonadota bacterium]
MRDVTQLLEAHRGGDAHALTELVERLYPVLKQLARRQLPAGRGRYTLNTTGVVHDAFLRFADNAECQWVSRDHFYAFAARVMRQVVVDHLRARSAAKRGDGKAPMPLEEEQVASPDSAPQRALLIDQLLDGLAEIDERLVQVVECRYFAGFTDDETAAALGVTARTVQRDWQRARAWLELAMSEHREPSNGAPPAEDTP